MSKQYTKPTNTPTDYFTFPETYNWAANIDSRKLDRVVELILPELVTSMKGDRTLVPGLRIALRAIAKAEGITLE